MSQCSTNPVFIVIIIIIVLLLLLLLLLLLDFNHTALTNFVLLNFFSFFHYVLFHACVDHACVGLNWLSPSFLSHRNKKNSFITITIVIHLLSVFDI